MRIDDSADSAGSSDEDEESATRSEEESNTEEPTETNTEVQGATTIDEVDVVFHIPESIKQFLEEDCINIQCHKKVYNTVKIKRLISLILCLQSSLLNFLARQMSLLFSKNLYGTMRVLWQQTRTQIELVLHNEQIALAVTRVPTQERWPTVADSLHCARNLSMACVFLLIFL